MSVITQVWVFCSIAPDGDEGVIALNAPDGTAMPMVCSDPTAIDSYKCVAHRIAHDNGIQIVVKRFATMTIEETIVPPPGAGVQH